MSGPELAVYRRERKVRQDDKRLLDTLGLQMPELSAIERGRLPAPLHFEEIFRQAVDRIAGERNERETAAA